MSVELDNGQIGLRGDCRVEDAEPLSALLLADRTRPVWLGDAEALHTAVIQVLVAFAPTLLGRPRDPFLGERITSWLPSAPPDSSGAAS